MGYSLGGHKESNTTEQFSLEVPPSPTLPRRNTPLGISRNSLARDTCCALVALSYVLDIEGESGNPCGADTPPGALEPRVLIQLGHRSGRVRHFFLLDP